MTPASGDPRHGDSTPWSVLILVAVVVLAGCVPGGSARARPGVVEVGEKTRTEAVDVFESIGRGVEATSYSGSGSAGWARCSDLLARQIAYGARFTITGTNVLAQDYPRVLRRQLRAENWRITDAGTRLIQAEKAGMRLSVEYGCAAINSSIRSRCLTAPRGLVKELDEEPRLDLGLQPPAEPRQY